MILIPIVSYLLITSVLLLVRRSEGANQALYPFREICLRSACLWGLFAAGITELLSVFNALHPIPVALAWLFVSLCTVTCLLRKIRSGFAFHIPIINMSLSGLAEKFFLIAAALILSCLFLIGVLKPEIVADVIAYELPRIMVWAHHGNLSPFITYDLRRLFSDPLADYLMLQEYLLSGGNRLTFLHSWASLAGSIIVVSLIVRELGGGGDFPKLRLRPCLHVSRFSCFAPQPGAATPWRFSIFFVLPIFLYRSYAGGIQRVGEHFSWGAAWHWVC
jgi:hypothetical protein